MSNIHVFGNRAKTRQVSENELSGITDKHRRFESGGLFEETANTPDIRLLPPPPPHPLSTLLRRIISSGLLYIGLHLVWIC